MFPVKFKKEIFFILLFLLAKTAFSQVIVDWNKGDHNQTKKGIMDGNLVETVYYNFGEVADWLNEPSRSGVWPKGTNHTYIDGVALIVQAETEDPQGKVIHPLETNYYEYTRYDPATGVTYGWWSLPGYANPFQSSPAQSSRANTWPLRWPDRPADWDGLWNGFFGKGIQNADLETYFVFDDNEDREYLLGNNFRPDADDPDRGGLGMQVKARGFQWSQVLAEDAIFWFYEITNMSTTDYEKTLFAQYIDWGIGGHDNSSNNAGSFNDLLDISYAWSTVPFGSPGNWSPVGLSSYAFLESPGISDDFKDNDIDGLTDERRDNDAKTFIENPTDDPFLMDAFEDTTKFREFYGFSWKPHWDADENGNWKTFIDNDENGAWDEGEPLNDDVGTDGIGPFNENYRGPDFDGTEGNGRPDQGEPNFGFLDKDESDQLGLTGFIIFPTHTPYDLDNDEENWEALSALPTPFDQSLVGVNLANFFSSYLFRLDGRNTYGQETGETERFSMALIFGIDKEDIFRRKRTVQQIYNANYRFAKPPEKPIVKFIAGDKRVTLYWDDRAEKTFDAFYQRVNFEGYRVYRSTEPNFLESKLITDAFGKPTYRKPLAQFDLIDGITGVHPIDVNGALFYLGDDTGLQHSYIDTTVQNGQTYYYAVVAYDRGFTTTTIEGEFIGIPPTETTSSIKREINGELLTDINTAVVTPMAPAAGYIAPEIKDQFFSGPATGSVSVNILDPDSLKEEHTYRIEFENFSAFHDDPNPSYRLIDYSRNDTIIAISRMAGDKVQTPVVHGFALDIKNDQSVVIDVEKTGWIKGESNYIVQVGFDDRFGYGGRRINYPADFEIHFTEKDSGDWSFPGSTFLKSLPTNIRLKNITENTEQVQFIFRDLAKDSLFNVANPDSESIDGDAVYIVYGDSAGKAATKFLDSKISWSLSFKRDTTLKEPLKAPQPGDIFRIATKKPFRSGEFVEFVSKAPSFNKQQAVSDLDKIAVVPNPYVGAASWEQSTSNVGRGERKLYFIHLPQKCTIRIYTIDGKLVKTLHHESGMDDGQKSWNLVTKDGMDVAFGIYVFHISAPGIGTKTGRFALIK
jgi:hypothetical protein